MRNIELNNCIECGSKNTKLRRMPTGMYLMECENCNNTGIPAKERNVAIKKWNEFNPISNDIAVSDETPKGVIIDGAISSNFRNYTSINMLHHPWAYEIILAEDMKKPKENKIKIKSSKNYLRNFYPFVFKLSSKNVESIESLSVYTHNKDMYIDDNYFYDFLGDKFISKCDCGNKTLNLDIFTNKLILSCESCKIDINHLLIKNEFFKTFNLHIKKWNRVMFLAKDIV